MVEKSPKIGIFTAQDAKYPANLYKDPRKSGAFPQITQFRHFTGRIHQKFGPFDVISLKNWEIHKFSIQLISNLTICGGETRKNWDFLQNGKRNSQK